MSKTLTFAQILSSPVLLPPSFLARGSSLWSLLASMVVPQQLSQKAFEKLASHQDDRFNVFYYSGIFLFSSIEY